MFSRPVSFFSSTSSALAPRRWRGRHESESRISSCDLSSRDKSVSMMDGVLALSAFPCFVSRHRERHEKNENVSIDSLGGNMNMTKQEKHQPYHGKMQCIPPF